MYTTRQGRLLQACYSQHQICPLRGRGPYAYLCRAHYIAAVIYSATGMTLAEASISTPNGSTSPEEALAYYKSQYEQLELELTEFQASSRELEAELEKDVEASEKRERQLQEKVEGLGFEVEEWKVSSQLQDTSGGDDCECRGCYKSRLMLTQCAQAKYKQSKSEANAAQSILEKEITTLRDTNRTTQLKLRDIEVANDDFERQARHTTSSLEDLESKYNVAIERAVMLEAEIHLGEQEREALRIEAQRLRDELSDMKIEAEITQGKLRRLEATAGQRERKDRPLPTDNDLPHSPTSDISPTTTASSPTLSTPPQPKSTTTSVSDTPTPPSPPMSELSATAISTKTPGRITQLRLPSTDASATPRPTQVNTRLPRHSRGHVTASTDTRSTQLNGRESKLRHKGVEAGSLPKSSSLRQIRGLIGQMQKLEQRVQSARSRLPAPVPSPSARASPQGSSAVSPEAIPSSVTVRSHKKRTGGSNVGGGSVRGCDDATPSSTNRANRASFGYAPPRPERQGLSRPSSRASVSSRASATYNNAMAPFQRPSSRTGARTPLGHYSSTSVAEVRRPRSSVGGSYATLHGAGHHGHSMSISGIEERPLGFSTPTPRRSTMRHDAPQLSSIPTPGTLLKRQSAGSLSTHAGFAMTPGARRTHSGAERKERDGEMRPPGRRRLSEVGETY